MKRLIHLCNNGVMGYLESGSAIKVSLVGPLAHFLFLSCDALNYLRTLSARRPQPDAAPPS
jgi:hypothetical protein